MDSLVGVCVVLRCVWGSQHATHHPATVQAPTQVAHLPPSPSMLHFHHTLCDQGALLGCHEDGSQTHFLDTHFTGALRWVKQGSRVKDTKVAVKDHHNYQIK